MTKKRLKDKVILVIRDGYGKRDDPRSNAVLRGATPFTDSLMKKYPTCLLRTSGNDVGLPAGYMGGSEVGHITIGSGRIIYQSLEKINKDIESGVFFRKEAFNDVFSYAKKHGKSVHLAGLLQNKGVHAHQNHLFALLKMAAKHNMPKNSVKIHIFSDGRDSPPKSLRSYLKELEIAIQKTGVGVISTLIGRYYSMDRDTRYDRTKIAYDLLVNGKGKKFVAVDAAVSSAYDEVDSDEFIGSFVIGDYDGMKKGDGFIVYNYRLDRVRQLCRALLDDSFKEFKVKSLDLKAAVMSEYYKGIQAAAAYQTESQKNLLGDVISDNGLKQLRISETEKYPHVTFFFNNQIEKPMKGEERVLLPSPRDVPTYDLKPEMSIYAVTDQLEAKIKKDEFSLIVVNFVNGDMVGHTGKMSAAVKAVEAVDKCLERTVKAGLESGYTLIVFADHGNCEEMSGEHKTSHTLNDVDCILVSSRKDLQRSKIKLKYGGLCDVAPTALDIMGLKKPKEMTGSSLIEKR